MQARLVSNLMPYRQAPRGQVKKCATGAQSSTKLNEQHTSPGGEQYLGAIDSINGTSTASGLQQRQRQ